MTCQACQGTGRATRPDEPCGWCYGTGRAEEGLKSRQEPRHAISGAGNEENHYEPGEAGLRVSERMTDAERLAALRQMFEVCALGGWKFVTRPEQGAQRAALLGRTIERIRLLDKVAEAVMWVRHPAPVELVGAAYCFEPLQMRERKLTRALEALLAFDATERER